LPVVVTLLLLATADPADAPPPPPMLEMEEEEEELRLDDEELEDAAPAPSRRRRLAPRDDRRPLPKADPAPEPEREPSSIPAGMISGLGSGAAALAATTACAAGGCLLFSAIGGFGGTCGGCGVIGCLSPFAPLVLAPAGFALSNFAEAFFRDEGTRAMLLKTMYGLGIGVLTGVGMIGLASLGAFVATILLNQSLFANPAQAGLILSALTFVTAGAVGAAGAGANYLVASWGQNDAPPKKADEPEPQRGRRRPPGDAPPRPPAAAMAF
jgi:hypothetical protein